MAEPDRRDDLPETSFAPPWYSWIPVALLFATFVVAAALCPRFGSRSFYESAAQVIPVIVLTLAIEARAFEWTLEWHGWKDRWERGLDPWVMVAMARVMVLITLVVAQIITMVRLTDRGSLENPQPKFVFGALVTGFAAVVISAVQRRATN